MLEIPDREVAPGALNDEDVLARLDVFRDEQSTKLLLGELEMCRENGDLAGVARIAERVRARLFDLSAFMKELKLRMNGGSWTSFSSGSGSILGSGGRVVGAR